MLPKDDMRRDDLDGGTAFLPDPRHGATRSRDTLAEMVGEQFVSSATSAEDQFDETRNAVSEDEAGGTLHEIDPEDEFAIDRDDLVEEEPDPFPAAKD
jgi:hypothetical protein